MKTISGKVISTKPVSLSDAAVIISDFAATETGASDAVSVYIRRAADAFNQLVQFHHDLRYPNSGTKFLAKERVDYALKSSQNREIFVKQEESVKTLLQPKKTGKLRSNEGEGGEALVVETKKRKSEDIDGSAEQNSLG
nr:nucleolar protein 58-like [Ipomoea batatas]